MAETVEIPYPPTYPLIGNLAEFTGSPVKDLCRIADTYGPIYKLWFGPKPVVFVANQALVNEVSDEKRFKKTLNTVLGEVRNGVHDGLFTADEDEPNWGKAHRVLIPAFGPLSIRGMFDEMHDIATQLAMKIARHGPQAPINASDDFTRLALDTLALCAMDYRFNSYYREELHPFIAAMGDFLVESGRRRKRPPFAPAFLYRNADAKYWEDIATMRNVADEVVAHRKANPEDRKDLLAAMLDGVDPRTKEKLDDANITDQLITFLIAGHETTSGLLSFCFYQLLKHPEAYQKVQQEVDEVIGRNPIKVDHLNKLPYIAGCLRETLRVNASIPGWNVEAKEDTLLAGKYFVKKGEPITALLSRSHVDPAVYGDDAEEFKPERMMDGNFERLNAEFPNCWKPFGNGKRSCIGRPFAWQEALLAVALLFQNFNFTMDDPSYTLQLQETLTIKPKDFRMRATLRHGMTPTELEQFLAGTGPGAAAHDHAVKATGGPLSPAAAAGKPIAVYYGSNSGTCEALANRLATDAPLHGFRASTVSPLDDAHQNLPKDRPVIIVTASYEGQPPSNAGLFCKWIEGLQGDEMAKLSYAVFGCGHHDWVQTFHRIPKLVDGALERLGGERIVPLAVTDAANRDMFTDFETWEDETLWPALKERYGAAEGDAAEHEAVGIDVEVTNLRKSSLRQDVEEALVLAERTLVESDTNKRHVEIRLPTGMSYRAGDYLAILPFNPKGTVSRVFRRFRLSWDASLKISSESHTHLPTGSVMSAADLLGAYVELSQPATKRNIQALIDATDDQTVIQTLKKLSSNDYHEKVTAKRVSVLDLLEQFEAIHLPLSSYLSMLPPMRVRQYSISSSPLVEPSTATLTYTILDQPSLSGQGRHVGVASTFLSSLAPGDKLHVSVRPSNTAFHLPADPEKTPIICVAAGSGIAPMRGFIQERAAMIAAGRKPLAPALLFFGCRRPGPDDLYADELAQWQSIGAVDVRRAYSRERDSSEGCKYVQDRLWHDRADVLELWDRGARVYVCGSRGVGQAVEDACVRLAMERKPEGKDRLPTEEEARSWWEGHRNERFATDVFD